MRPCTWPPARVLAKGCRTPIHHCEMISPRRKLPSSRKSSPQCIRRVRRETAQAVCVVYCPCFSVPQETNAVRSWRRFSLATVGTALQSRQEPMLSSLAHTMTSIQARRYRHPWQGDSQFHGRYQNAMIRVRNSFYPIPCPTRIALAGNSSATASQSSIGSARLTEMSAKDPPPPRARARTRTHCLGRVILHSHRSRAP